MNAFNYANPYDFEPRREDGDFVDNIDNEEVELSDEETEDWRLNNWRLDIF